MLDENMPAHITLAMWNSDYDYIEEIKRLAKAEKSFDINFSSLGLFNDDERHIFLSPVKNDELIKIHRGVYDAINLEDEGDYIKVYKDTDVWVPHLTIGYQIKRENLSKAFDLCTDIKFPIKAKAIKMAYAVCCPFHEIAILDLA
jgi:2'-5' RNA ligase